MPVLEWDKFDERPWMSGLDRGVLYTHSGEAIPWNGLVSYNEKTSVKGEAAYFDGYKIHDITTLKGCDGVVEAITYPEILDSVKEFTPGAVLSQQGIESFNFSYRQKLDSGGYEIHLFGNMTFVSNTLSYTTISDQASPMTFKFDASAPRVQVSGIPPTCHLSVNTDLADPQFITWFEEQLYGSSTVSPSIPDFSAFLAELRDWTIVAITNNGDGTWTASTPYPNYIFDLGANEFRIDNADITYLNADTYEIGDI